MQSPLCQPLRLHYIWSTGLWPTNSSWFWWWSMWQKQRKIVWPKSKSEIYSVDQSCCFLLLAHNCLVYITHTHVCACALLVRSNLVNASNFSFVFTGCSHWNRLGAVIFKTFEQMWCYWPETNYFCCVHLLPHYKTMYKSINTLVKIAGQIYKWINHK